MNLLVLIVVVVALFAVRYLKPNALAWAAAWWIAVFTGLRFGIDPPLPSSVLWMFMFITTLSQLAYLGASGDRMKEVAGGLVSFFVDRRFTVPLVIVLLLVPLLVAFKVYLDITSSPRPPIVTRTIHPPPPPSISFHGKKIDLITVDNPYRGLETSDPATFTEHVDNGRRVYYQNCVFCHGDNMEGDGLFAHGFDPFPADFQDATTIAMLQESYLFWRIATGAPGLPSESTPWSSSMPAWETFLTEEEIWDVILFLYDYTGQRPRARETHE